jgi:hypothetical protein
MMKTREQLSFDVGDYAGLYDILIPEDNFWRRLNEAVDFSFVYDFVKDTYSENMGRTAVDCVVMFKYLLLKNYHKLSDVDLVERTRTDMVFKYFLGYTPEETHLIDPSTLTKFRREHLVVYKTDENNQRVKVKDESEKMLNKMIAVTVEIALEKGVIKKENDIIIDSTHSNSIYQHISPRQKMIKQAKELRKVVYHRDESMKEKMPAKRENTGNVEDMIEYSNELTALIEANEVLMSYSEISEKVNLLKETVSDTSEEVEYSRDSEAKVGHKTADSSFFGYKTHIGMTPERVIVSATVTTGEKSDGTQLPAIVEYAKEAGVIVNSIIGDGAYSEEKNLNYCKENNIKNISKLSSAVTHGNRKTPFEYNKDAGMYVCPAGHMAVKKSHCKPQKSRNNSECMTYFFDVEHCKRCPLREGCYRDGAKSKTYTVTIKKDIHKAQMDYMETDEFKESYAHRYKIEAKNAELKKAYGYDRANACGTSGMTIQGMSALFLANMKRIFKLEDELEGNRG